MQRQTSDNTPRRSLVLTLPPPLVFAAAFGVGAVIEYYTPVSVAPVPNPVRIAGALVLAAGVLLAVSLATTFLLRRTTLIPFAEPSVFVAAGPYRFSRNPMYLSLMVAYLGAVLLFGSVWPLVTLLAPLAQLARVVVPYEEAQMIAAFGESYRAYRAQVRRWI